MFGWYKLFETNLYFKLYMYIVRVSLSVYFETAVLINLGLLTTVKDIKSITKTM